MENSIGIKRVQKSEMQMLALPNNIFFYFQGFFIFLFHVCLNKQVNNDYFKDLNVFAV